ncbi:hypothetical protein OC835_001274 [Tilletia horrida]|uniref:Uncharacterized protein n=1 Tax=Tilletia horrida TaxID=155126 RepID=A0AAN6JME3_9BASI|nr:hypothetical protein OC842_001288 [Tilletia horrida]KAK0538961.1 hypothetical protein OC835_001274 [Tilletia horrida]
MAAIPFPTDGTTPQAQQPPSLGPGAGSATGASASLAASTGPPSSISDVTPPAPSSAQTPGAGPSHSAIGSISMPSAAPHSAGGPGPIPMPPPPLRIGYGMGTETHGPPSPSTLTDVILGLHATLYASKKSSDEVMQMVSRYYDNDAVFESPLLQARGREQIANQFKMAFALPGMDVQSELRDVICSDFEFDGTRAGIIDHTLTITLFPTLFGSSAPYPEAGGASATGFGGRSGMFSSQFGGGNRSYGGSVAGGVPTTGNSSYFHGRQSGTASAGLSSFTVPGGSYFHQMHPFTPISAVQTPYGYPGHNASTFAFSKDDDDDARSFSGTRRRSEVGKNRPTPVSAGANFGHDDDEGMDPERDGETGRQFSYGMGSYSGHAGSIAGEDDTSGDLSFSTSGGARVSGTGSGAVTTQVVPNEPARPAMPAEALMPHWSASGFGRASVRAFVWSLFHPRAALKALCSFQIRVMTRLEFNDNGMIVRHEDMWSVREAIEGMVPFAGLVYALERRIVGFLVSWAVASGFTISQLLLSRAIDSHPRVEGSASATHTRKDEGPGGRASWTGLGGDAAAHEVERALLQHQQRLDRERERASSSATHSRQPTYSSIQGDYPYATFSRSRAPSPTRRFGSISGGASSTNLVTGTRSRARSLIGQNPHLRAASSQNLLQWSNSNSAYPNAHAGSGGAGGGGGGASAGWH